MYDAKINAIVSILQKSNNILFITGAGISADSGLPTYRGVTGLYENKLTHDKITIEEALSGKTMSVNPEITWKYLAEIEKSCRNASYNRAHEIIAKLEKYFRNVLVLTQNIDRFHQDAGSKNVIDIHGDIHHLHCTSCSYKMEVLNYADIIIPPKCPKCSFILRPDVVLFGEMLSQEKVNRLSKELTRGFDIIFTIGTTSVFPYISDPVIQAAIKNIPTIEINPSETEVSSVVRYKLSMTSVEALEKIYNRLLEIA